VDNTPAMLLYYAFVGEETISNTTPHGMHARMTWRSFSTPSQLLTIDSLWKANQRQ
jgi:hypothetical protein